MVEAADLIGSTQVQGRATMGGNLCNGSPAADSVPALIAAGAVARIVGPDGRASCRSRTCARARQDGAREGRDRRLGVPAAAPPRSGDAYLRFIPRTEMDIAVVGAGVSLTLDEARHLHRRARVGLGAVAPRPLLVPKRPRP